MNAELIKEQIQKYSNLVWLIERSKVSLDEISAEIEKRILSLPENERPYYLQSLFTVKQGTKITSSRHDLYLAGRSGIEKDNCGRSYYNHYGLRLTIEEAEEFFKTPGNLAKPISVQIADKNVEILEDCESLAVEIFEFYNQPCQ